MARLNAQQKRDSATFTTRSKTGKTEGHFPMPDKAHARLARQMEKFAPPAERPKIEARANKILGKKGK